ncbi:putative Zinc finger C x8 C x5 C x3 H type (and similar) [Trypanosoma vivax]|uniref:C3H1-type domain-containing protein n=1 Tax=Trypanosoma vivax (strain Y486) TaxID=1055687 RepID=G0TVD1_TRYVY|nr:hypothetical protein TRVL_01083 [Trypanosoma vivax]KAH8617724.1 putative Zinc finger C x8 C x5 C x3 H type (and similar) [Trypanosoma vivax]CCC47897.1 conserved hypothetical protein [Trypanosoma vivax Y486]
MTGSKKGSKHVEVKPSKFRTALCNYYERNQECPFGSRCAFAHGKHELQTEEQNIKILRSTGLLRLDGTDLSKKALCASGSTENSLNPSLPSTPTVHRQSIVVSIPFSLENRHGYSCGNDSWDTAASMKTPSAPTLLYAVTPNNAARRSSRFAAAYSDETPLRYRHNPYGLVAR